MKQKLFEGKEKIITLRPPIKSKLFYADEMKPVKIDGELLLDLIKILEKHKKERLC